MFSVIGRILEKRPKRPGKGAKAPRFDQTLRFLTQINKYPHHPMDGRPALRTECEPTGKTTRGKELDSSTIWLHPRFLNYLQLRTRN